MGLLDKIKNLFTEEEPEVEQAPKEEIQKEVIQVEIPSPAKTTRAELHAEDTPSQQQPTKQEHKFTFFDDNDFDTIDVKPEVKETKENKKQPLYRKNEVYNPPKEDKKVFRPSPIISPVYGIMDKGYEKEDMERNDNRPSYYSSKEPNVDEIRNKAYGSLESDIETTLFGGGRVLFDDKEETKETAIETQDDIKKIDEEKKPEEADKYGAETIGEKPRHSDNKEEDLTDLLQAEMATPAEETKKETRKISDEELFGLIDSMYEKEGK
jgi:hypothetical protein